jgi:hypothetical protein
MMGGKVKMVAMVCFRRLRLLALAFAAACMLMPSVGAHASSLEDLKKELEVLQRKVAELEAREASNAEQLKAMDAPQVSETPPSEAVEDNFQVTRGEGGGTFNFHLPGIDTDVRIGGYIKTDVVYSDVSAGIDSDFDRYFYPRSIPVGPDADESSDKLVITAKQSRLFVKTRSATPLGDFKIHLEGDFYGQGGNQVVSNSSTWRLRHAYGELGNLLIGQTWSTFMNCYALPETVDFGGPAGQIFVRQAQVRWTQPFQWGSLQFSAENPETFLLVSDTGASSTYDDDRIPDIVGRVNYDSDFGKFSLALMGREYRIDESGVADDSTYAGAVSAAGIVPTFGKDDFRFMLNYGNGLGRYMYTNFEGAVLDVDADDLSAVDQWGGFLAYRHYWLDALRSSLVYSYGEADNDADVVGESVNKRFQSVHANLIWSPIPAVNLGLEYLWGQRELENDEDGDLNRVQFGAQYLF